MPSIPLTPTAQGERQSTGVKSCLHIPCPAALHIPALSSSWAGEEHSTASPSSLLCKAAFFVGAKEERSGGIFFSISINTLGKKAAAGNSQLSRAELRGSRAFCISATNPCPAWDFFSLGRLGKLSCGASCSSFPLSVPTSLFTPM